MAHLKDLQRQIHTHFIDLVRERRGDRLADEPELFSGLFWAGRRAIELGLADGVGEVRAVLRERYGEDIRLRVLHPVKPPLLRRLFGGVAGAAVAEIDERMLWARYGL